MLGNILNQPRALVKGTKKKKQTIKFNSMYDIYKRKIRQYIPVNNIYLLAI